MVNENFYTKLRKRVKDWENSEKGQKHKYVEYFLAIPDLFYVVFKLEFDPRIPIETKLKLGGVLFYWFMPIDIIPEAIFGLFGYLDDMALSVMVLSGLMEKHGEVVEEYWYTVSDKDILETFRNIIEGLNNLIGQGLWNKVKKMYRTKFSS